MDDDFKYWPPDDDDDIEYPDDEDLPVIDY